MAAATRAPMDRHSGTGSGGGGGGGGAAYPLVAPAPASPLQLSVAAAAAAGPRSSSSAASAPLPLLSTKQVAHLPLPSGASEFGTAASVMERPTALQQQLQAAALAAAEHAAVERDRKRRERDARDGEVILFEKPPPTCEIAIRRIAPQATYSEVHELCSTFGLVYQLRLFSGVDRSALTPLRQQQLRERDERKANKRQKLNPTAVPARGTPAPASAGSSSSSSSSSSSGSSSTLEAIALAARAAASAGGGHVGGAVAAALGGAASPASGADSGSGSGSDDGSSSSSSKGLGGGGGGAGGGSVAAVGDDDQLNYAYVVYHSQHEARAAAKGLNRSTFGGYKLRASASPDAVNAMALGMTANVWTTPFPLPLTYNECVAVANHFLGCAGGWSCAITRSTTVEMDYTMWSAMRAAMQRKRQRIVTERTRYNPSASVPAPPVPPAPVAPTPAAPAPVRNQFAPPPPPPPTPTAAASSSSAAASGAGVVAVEYDDERMTAAAAAVAKVPDALTKRKYKNLPPKPRADDVVGMAAYRAAEAQYYHDLDEWNHLNAQLPATFVRHAHNPLAFVVDTTITLRNGVTVTGKGVGHPGAGEHTLENAKKRAVSAAYCNAWRKLAVVRLRVLSPAPDRLGNFGWLYKTDVRVLPAASDGAAADDGGGDGNDVDAAAAAAGGGGGHSNTALAAAAAPCSDA